jgi:hypothetical protein
MLEWYRKGMLMDMQLKTCGAVKLHHPYVGPHD